jgi:hypothetical protein
MMNKAQITKIVIRLATRPKWSIEARRDKVSQMIAEEIQRSDELNQALMELDILLDKLQKIYQEVDDVCEHLLKHYFKSEYIQMNRPSFLNTNTIEDSKAGFIKKLLEVSDSRKSLKVQDSEITTHSIYHKIDPGLRIALNNNIVTLLTIDNELIDLKVMYEFLIENCENE